MQLRVKRAYEPADKADGMRILVDRLWPRGLKREVAAVDLWLKDLAPSDDLRRRFHANPDAFAQFRTAYVKELAKPAAAAAMKTLRQATAKGAVTLLFAARDEERNNALVLRDWLLGN